ncbi:MAG: hypothetical protein GC153_06975 [Alphaproteobacteria bacterium]|nr:hypothetical protein [Alphaproteobacteria bacterium]
MRKLVLVSVFALVAACSAEKPAQPASGDGADEAAAPAIYVAGHDALVAMKQKFADIDMDPDVSFLSEEDKQVVNLLNQAASIMSEIYLRQRDEDNPKWRAEIAASNLTDKDLLLQLFDLNMGPWDSLDHDKPFYGSTALPAGAGFYPADMTKDEFEQWIAAHPEDEQAFKSPYTVIRRDENGGLKAIPYSEYYKEWLEPAAGLLRQAARITSNASLKKFLMLRADAFLSDDYYQSELAWMDLKGPIEVAIGPYEVYTDKLFGYKTAFEAFVTVKNPAESAAVAKYKNYLHDMEANLPVDDKYKNFNRGSDSPIAVANQVHGGGDNAKAVQTVAFNLPNDERVREAKGAKKVLLNNVLDAKFQTILQPMAEHVLVPDQASLLVKKYMGLETLFHELSHSMGPGTITVDGRETTVGAQLKELYSAIEEGKADVMGAWNILYMMQRGDLPAAEKNNFLATYFVGVFRAMRFGTNEAHGRGAAFQYHYMVRNGGAVWDADAQRYRIDFAKLERAIKDLTHDVVVIEGNGDYAAAKTFLDQNAVTDDNAKAVIASMADIPVDIDPHYKEKI